MRRVLSVLMILVLALSAFAITGCSSEPAPAEEPATTEEPMTEETMEKNKNQICSTGRSNRCTSKYCRSI